MDISHRDAYSLDVPVERPPRRVVSLVPSLTESLFDLNLGDRVVGITDYCIHPAQLLAGLPRLGGTKNPDIARIIALHPDLVLMNREENRLEDAEALKNAGIAVWASHPQTVSDAINLLWEIMNVFDEPAMVERVRWIERQMDWTLGATADIPPARVFVPVWHAPWITISGATYIHDLLRVCGGANVFGTDDLSVPYPTTTLDDIISRQPEVILLPDEPFSFGQQHVAMLAALDIPAARNGHIHVLDGTLLTWHGTRMAQAFSELPPLLAVHSPD